MLGNTQNPNYSCVMDGFFRFSFFIIKASCYSLFAGLFGFFITVSFINGNFPPTWDDVKSVKRKIEYVVNHKKEGMFKSINEKYSKDDALKGGYSDPELADVNEVIKYHKNQAKLSKNLIEGEMTFGSNPPPIEKPMQDTETKELSERVRKLEDLVSHLQNQIQTLKTQSGTQR